MRMGLLLIQWWDKKESDMKALPNEIPTLNLLFIWASLVRRDNKGWCTVVCEHSTVSTVPLY